MSRRTIPTGVGKMVRSRVRDVWEADHPHGRGENKEPIGREFEQHGPSPRAWGKSPPQTGVRPRAGTIPTGVGKIFAARSATALSADHPHGRGENAMRSEGVNENHGPSPRAWGKCLSSALPADKTRTIPTGVGKIPPRPPNPAVPPDHPHGRGENDLGHRARADASGPSPRAWGK